MSVKKELNLNKYIKIIGPSKYQSVWLNASVQAIGFGVIQEISQKESITLEI